ncbi:MAG: S1 RNA-binding domain-containing protein [Phycisphaerae bacterium]
MSGEPRREESKFRPVENLDAALQRELDEALGDMSLEDIVEAEEKARRGPTAGKTAIRKGTVIAIQGDDIFVDMGGKSQGVLAATQFSEEEELPKEGEAIDVTIEGFDSANGLLVLSREGAVMEATWETLEEGQVVEGRVTEHNKGGLVLTINGIEAFMPISQIEMFRVDELAPYVNQKLRCVVMEVNQEDRKVIVSRREILQKEAEEAREKMFAELVEGKTVRGVVKNIMSYGAFVDIGGADGLLHVKDMSHSRVEDPREIVKEGQTLELMVLKVDKEARKIALGLKQVLPDPWAGVAEKYPVGVVVTGRITRLAEFGAFMELESGVEGLVPIGEMTFERRIKHPSEIVKEGDVTRAKVMSVDLERKRISLSIKRAGEDPWTGASARWPEKSEVQGVVKRITEFGAFVEITPGVEGLIHISELSADRVRSVSDVVREGQLVKAKVLTVEEDRRRIALSLKQVGQEEFHGEYSTAAPGPAPQAEVQAAKGGKKRRKPLKGGLD